MPEPRPYTPRPDDSAADIESLVDLGMAEEQPEPQAPSTDPFLEPVYDPPLEPDDAA